MTMDCSTMPSESGCTLVITGEEDEVLRAAAAHAVDIHGHTDDENLRNALRASLTEAAAALELQPGAFVQIIEFHTERIDDLISLGQGWTEAIGSDRTARWELVGADRNAPGRYLQIVAFPDHESAMANSKHPATSTFAKKLGELCEGEVVFNDLDVRMVEVF
jgi:hypothetical protein